MANKEIRFEEGTLPGIDIAGMPKDEIIELFPEATEYLEEFTSKISEEVETSVE